MKVYAIRDMETGEIVSVGRRKLYGRKGDVTMLVNRLTRWARGKEIKMEAVEAEIGDWTKSGD